MTKSISNQLFFYLLAQLNIFMYIYSVILSQRGGLDIWEKVLVDLPNALNNKV